MSTLPPFTKFPKIPRLSREIVITEKIDGTNASVYVPHDPEEPVLAASRNRWITPEDDNYGFAEFVAERANDFRTLLGPGHHFGEWWGKGIQRGYGMSGRRFSLFNTARWSPDDVLPDGVSVVPVLGYAHGFHTLSIDIIVNMLSLVGSTAAPGFMDPEGVVVFHTAANALFKYTLDGDGNKGS